MNKAFVIAIAAALSLVGPLAAQPGSGAPCTSCAHTAGATNYETRRQPVAGYIASRRTFVSIVSDNAHAGGR